MATEGSLHNIIFRKITRPKLIPFLKKYRTDKKTLDIGGGYGKYKEYFPNSVIIDKQKGEAVDIVGDAHNLPFGDNSFEVVLCLHVLDDCEDPYRVAGEMKRVLMPDGFMILCVPFIYPINDGPDDYWRFTPYTLKKLFGDMEEIEISPVLKQMETIALIFQRLSYQGRGTKAKRFLFGFLAWAINALNLDRWIDQSGYPTIGRKPGTEIDNIVTALYFAVFKKK